MCSDTLTRVRTRFIRQNEIVSLHAVADPRVLRRAAAFVADRRRKLPQELRHFLAEVLD